MLGIALVGTAWAAPPHIDLPLRTNAQANRDAAVVIGVETYAFLPDVEHARSDARAMHNTMVYTRGIPAEQVQLLQNANREQILSAVQRAREAADGMLWITFSGHGAASPDTGELLLVGDDAKSDAQVFLSRSVSVSELVQAAGGDVTLLLDTCHAGRGAQGSHLVEGARFAVPVAAMADSQPRSDGVVRIWTAARPSEIAQTYAPASHGLFTYFAVGAWRGWADGELDGQPDGRVTLREAHAYVARAIGTVDPGGQMPTLEGSDVDLVRSSALQAPPDLGQLPKVHRGSGEGAIAPIPVTRGQSVGIEPPVTFQGGRLFADAQGRTVQLSSIERVTAGYMATDKARRRYENSLWVKRSGIYAVGLTALYSVLLSSSLYNAEEGKLGPLAPYSIAGAGIGIGLFGVGSVIVPSARNHYLDEANAVLSTQAQ